MMDTVACPRCGASCRKGSEQTWQDVDTLRCGKCGSQFAVSVYGDGKQDAKIVDKPVESSSGWSFELASLMLIITLIAVCCGLIVRFPGLGIVLAILALPPLVRTLLVVQRRKKSGRGTGTSSKIGLYLESLIVTGVVVTALVTTILGSLIVSLFVMCTAGLGTNRNSDLLPVLGILCGVLSLVVLAMCIWPFWTWIRARWRRDTSQD